MTSTEQAYVEGFMAKCAEFGLKEAQVSALLSKLVGAGSKALGAGSKAIGSLGSKAMNLGTKGISAAKAVPGSFMAARHGAPELTEKLVHPDMLNALARAIGRNPGRAAIMGGGGLAGAGLIGHQLAQGKKRTESPIDMFRRGLERMPRGGWRTDRSDLFNRGNI